MIHTVSQTVSNDSLWDERVFDIQRMIEDAMITKLARGIFNYYSDAIERYDDPLRRQTSYRMSLHIRTQKDVERSMEILQDILEDNGLSENKAKDIILSFKKYIT